jgi:Mn2+/Fe2+ NRAMP family transporter
MFTIVIAACMMLLGGIAFFNHIEFKDVPTYAQQLATHINPLLDNFLFLMVINASIIGTAGVSLSTSWAYAEDRNWERSLNKNFKEAKGFYLQYFGAIIASGLIVLYPHLPLEKVIIGVQIMACVFLPYQLILNQIIVNDSNIMGEYKNKKWQNFVMNLIIVLIVILSVCLFKQGIWG